MGLLPLAQPAHDVSSSNVNKHMCYFCLLILFMGDRGGACDNLAQLMDRELRAGLGAEQ